VDIWGRYSKMLMKLVGGFVGFCTGDFTMFRPVSHFGKTLKIHNENRAKSPELKQ
jgi:hypothetical protein